MEEEKKRKIFGCRVCDRWYMSEIDLNKHLILRHSMTDVVTASEWSRRMKERHSYDLKIAEGLK